MSARETVSMPYPVKVHGEGEGIVFAWTRWGRDRIRWYWVRFDADGREKAFSASELTPLS